MLILALLVFTVWTVAVPVGANSVSVTRELPDYVKQNEKFDVTLNQSGFFLESGIVWEVLPEGFEYVYGSYTGGAPDKVTYDPITRTLMMPFFKEASIEYSVKASSYVQTANFSGTWESFDVPNEINGTVIGDAEVTVEKAEIFDTGSGTSPSISGIHKGTIKPNVPIEVSTLYTYPCPGTGGHTEYARIWNNNTGLDTTATWEGYVGGWHKIAFNPSFTLIVDETYNYTIRTGSYPQIHHEYTLQTANGWINCTEFIDVNGKVHYDWIPAIKLFW